MDKQILKDYIDACAQVKETKEQIRKLRKARKQMVADTSKGSAHEFPYRRIIWRGCHIRL